MSQSVGYVGSSLRRRVVGECRCGETPVIRTVTNNTNPNCGKKFWGCKNCRNHYEKGCGFFKLVDEEQVDDRDLLYAKLERKNLKLKNELEKTRRWLKMSTIFGLAWFGLCLVLGTVLLCRISACV